MRREMIAAGTDMNDVLLPPTKDFLAALKESAPGKICQHQFRRNDIVWICRTCQNDETCVQCNACFQLADHSDHEVYFYHSQAGGCCDCGDPDAWLPSGFCTKHGENNVSSEEALFVPEDMSDLAALLFEKVSYFHTYLE